MERNVGNVVPVLLGIRNGLIPFADGAGVVEEDTFSVVNPFVVGLGVVDEETFKGVKPFAVEVVGPAVVVDGSKYGVIPDPAVSSVVDEGVVVLETKIGIRPVVLEVDIWIGIKPVVEAVVERGMGINPVVVDVVGVVD